MSSPILTVCIPAYNQPVLLRETLTSLLAQDLRRDEFVVVISDDASPLSLADVAAEFSDRMDIVYDRNPENIGHIKNWERSSLLTDTKYLSFLAHDDVIAPGHLRRALDAIEARPGVVLVPSLVLCQRYPGAADTYMHGNFLLGEKASFTTPYRWDPTEWMALSLTGTPLSIIGAIFDTAAFRKCNTWRPFPLWHDRLMLAEMGMYGDVVSLPWIAGYYRIGSFQLSGKLWNNDRKEFRAVSNVILDFARQANLPVIDFWVDYICAAPADRRMIYLRMLTTALSTKQFTEIRQACEQRLGMRLPLTRLERFHVPPMLANLVRELDRALTSKMR